MGRPGSRKKPGSGMSPSRRGGGKKLYACANKTCPNQSHYTPSCPNLGRESSCPGPSSSAALVEPFPETFSRKGYPQNGDSSGLAGKVTGLAGKVTGSAGGMFDRAVAAAEAAVREPESFPTMCSDGTVEWKDTSGELHRENDRPAVIHSDGAKEWWWHGAQHREGDQPAVIYPGRRQEWWWHDQLHRDNDLPARIYADGRQEWWWHDQLHREGGQPAIMYADGSRIWYQHGKLCTVVHSNGTEEWFLNNDYHRDGDLPAISYPNGTRSWRRYGEPHRVLGPALTYPNGYQEWWFRGTETEHPDLCEQACAPARTEEEKTQLALLCLHDDPVVAAVAAHNPSCPEEGVAAYYLKHA